jgi:hypothetical protein
MRVFGSYDKPGMAPPGTLAPAQKRRRRVFELTGPAAPPTHEQIACRAFELFQARGDEDGDALADWFAAERELRERASMAATVGRRVAHPHH